MTNELQGYPWDPYVTAESLQFTRRTLERPAESVVRVLETASVGASSIERRLTFEYDNPGMAHFFPALIVPVGRLLDTFKVDKEDNVLSVTLAREESMTVGRLLLQDVVKPALEAATMEIDRYLLEILPTIAATPLESNLDLLSLLSAIKHEDSRSLTASEIPETIRLIADNDTWRLLRMHMANRVVYVPVEPLSVSGPRRQKVSIEYEQDRLSAAATFRSRLRAATGHDLDDLHVGAHGIGRSRSYHFRLRGAEGQFVKSVDVMTPKQIYAQDDWYRPRPDELVMAESDFHSLDKPTGTIDNLVHVHATLENVVTDALGLPKRYTVHAVFRDRPAGHLGATIARLIVALIIMIGIGTAAQPLVASTRVAGLPVTLLFALPTLLAVVQGLRKSTYAVSNIATILSGGLPLVGGMLYLRWAADGKLPDSWYWSRFVYATLCALLSAIVLGLSVMLVLHLRDYVGRARAS